MSLFGQITKLSNTVLINVESSSNGNCRKPAFSILVLLTNNLSSIGEIILSIGLGGYFWEKTR